MLKQTGISRSASWQDNYVRTVRTTDAAMMAVTVAAAQLIRFGFDSGTLLVQGFRLPYWGVGVLLGLAWWAWLELRGTRDIRLVGQGIEESKELVNATLVLFGAIAIVSYAMDIPTARGYVIVALPLGMGLLLLGRGRIRRQLVYRRQAGVGTSRAMVVGCPPGVLETVRSLRKHPGAGFDPVAVYAPMSLRPLDPSLASMDQPPNLLPDGHFPEVPGLLEACRDRQIEVLVLCASAPFSPEEIRHLSWYLADERIRLVLDTGLTDIAGPRIHTQLMAGLPLIHVSTPKMNSARLLLKRTVDVVGAGGALLALSPVMLALALIVKAHDGGPAFFTQERIGLDGSRFRMLKFRSMYVDAEERRNALLAANEGAGGVLFKMKNDPRVTTPGRWMRKYSLDELPQLVNVLAGQMSLVGPRPPLASEVEKYEDHVHRRLRVKPGITGLWQVSGRSNLDWDQAVRLDLYYVENWSPVQDLVILLRTVKAVLARDGAY
ncbi:sugar transferase [Kocuria sp. CH-021]|uniref:sugar transferase n=1 Tax=Kocuria sp. CH-021 TaxID=3406735 RepID=UPI003C72F2F1